VGIYNEKGTLDYVGHVGGGFDASLLEEVYKKLKPLVQKKCPFQSEPKPNASVTWVNPTIVCEVTFSEWTRDNIMRHPIFLGLRTDQSPQKVKKEIITAVPKGERSTAVKGLKVELTNLDKVYWPKEKYTKGDLLHYYETVASYILPYLKDRPITLHRYPEGIEGHEFYQKDLPASRPSWIKTCEIQQEGKLNHYLLITDINSLLYAVNLGSIDLHPLISRCKDLANPDYCVIDLDPQGISFDKVVEAALMVHELLDNIKIKHFCKTSGGRGLHIVIPLHGNYDYEESRRFAEIITLWVHKQLPRTTSLERSPNKRTKKIYLDYLQNRISQTIVAPYAARPRPGAHVSTPLKWEEVNERLDPGQFNIKTVPARLSKLGDIFKPVLKEKNNLKKALALLSKMVETK
jgi:bifunctional non-homologous end joining protein LigD